MFDCFCKNENIAGTPRQTLLQSFPVVFMANVSFDIWQQFIINW